MPSPYVIDPWVTTGDLPRLTGLSAVQLWRLRKAGLFPEPQTWGFLHRWDVAVVRAWTRQRRRAGRRR
jgi:predicted DNA-binding transcriptional regulator AlpA